MITGTATLNDVVAAVTREAGITKEKALMDHDGYPVAASYFDNTDSTTQKYHATKALIQGARKGRQGDLTWCRKAGYLRYVNRVQS